MFRYSVTYYREDSMRLWHMTVTAADADDARRVVAEADPKYKSTARSPRRGARILVKAEAHA